MEIKELNIEAEVDNLSAVQTFLKEQLDEAGCPKKKWMQIRVAAEEIFVNIASYAYAPGKGMASVRIEIGKDPAAYAEITFFDRGTPYNPLKKEDPDITLSVMEREIGGLGIFMTKKLMDDIWYEYKDGQNILTMKKNIQEE